MKLLKYFALTALLLLAVFFTTWLGMGVAMLCIQPARRGLETVLILGLFASLAALCFLGFARLRR